MHVLLKEGTLKKEAIKAKAEQGERGGGIRSRKGEEANCVGLGLLF